jgi:hypothetical protein
VLGRDANDLLAPEAGPKREAERDPLLGSRDPREKLLNLARGELDL